jgi:putative membrane protein
MSTHAVVTPNSLAGQPLDLANPSVRLAAERTAMAVDRTRLAHERTLMAWVRTATSLISFGFTIYKAFQYMQDQQPGVVHRAFSPRVFALTMIALGVGALALATVQHWREVGSLFRTFGQPVPRSTARLVASIVSCLGIAALILVLLRQ